MSTWNKRNFSIYTSDERSALGLIKELGDLSNEIVENVEKLDEEKTSLTGDHKGTWQGLNPIQTDLGLASTISKLVDNEIPNIKNELLNTVDREYVTEQIAIAKLDGASVDTTSFITKSDIDYLLIKSNNKFNPNKLVKDKYVKNGVLTEYIGWNTTDYIRIEGNAMSLIIFKTEEMSYVQGNNNTWVEVNNVFYAFYDSKYQYINGGSVTSGSFLNQVSIPSNAKFIRFSQSNKMLNDTSTLTFSFSQLSYSKLSDYTPYYVELDGAKYITEDDANDMKNLLNKSSTIKSINRLGYDVYGNNYPEHTLEGYKLALKYGFDEILCDLRSTSDSIPVCLHDETINRTARNTDGTTLSSPINILDITYATANSYDYGLYKSITHKGTKLLTLENVVKFAKMMGVTLHIETKCGTTEKEMAMITKAVNIVKKYNMSKKVAWSATSSNRAVLQKIISLDKYARVGTMPMTLTTDRIEELKSLKTGFNSTFWFAWDTSTIPDDMLNLLIENEIDVEIGTLNTEESINNLFNSNLCYVTGVSSDKLVAKNVLK